MPATQLIPVDIPNHPYTVEIGPNLLPQIGLAPQRAARRQAPPPLRRSPRPRSGDSTGPRPASRVSITPLEVLEVPAGEQHKRLATIETLVEALAEKQADRDSVLIAFGGGVIGDMTGFLAAIYMRGIRYIGVPTTLLAQVDSSLGGKTGANLAAGKNLIGAFHHPLAVYSDTSVLATLPPAELRAGLQESVKAGIIRDRALFGFMERHHESHPRARP